MPELFPSNFRAVGDSDHQKHIVKRSVASWDPEKINENIYTCLWGPSPGIFDLSIARMKTILRQVEALA